MHAHPELELQDESCQRSPCWPTSQDLQSAFALNGDDDVHISVVDAQGHPPGVAARSAAPNLVVAPVNSSGYMRPAGAVRAGRAA